MNDNTLGALYLVFLPHVILALFLVSRKVQLEIHNRPASSKHACTTTMSSSRKASWGSKRLFVLGVALHGIFSLCYFAPDHNLFGAAFSLFPCSAHV